RGRGDHHEVRQEPGAAGSSLIEKFVGWAKSPDVVAVLARDPRAILPTPSNREVGTAWAPRSRGYRDSARSARARCPPYVRPRVALHARAGHASFGVPAG